MIYRGMKFWLSPIPIYNHTCWLDICFVIEKVTFEMCNNFLTSESAPVL